MKRLKRFGILSVAIAAIGIATPLVAKADAFIGPPPTWNITLTNLIVPASIASATTSNLVSQPFRIIPGYGIGMTVCFTNGGTSTSNQTFSVNISVDGTNWPTIIPATQKVIFAGNGASGVIGNTNFPASMFDGCSAFRVETWQNGDGAAAITPAFILLGHTRVGQIR